MLIRTVSIYEIVFECKRNKNETRHTFLIQCRCNYTKIYFKKKTIQLLHFNVTTKVSRFASRFSFLLDNEELKLTKEHQ